MTTINTGLSKLQYAKRIAYKNNCFVVERNSLNDKIYILYRKSDFSPNIKIGKSNSEEGILDLVKKVCVVK